MTEEIINSDGSRNWQANILLDNVKRLEQENKELKSQRDEARIAYNNLMLEIVSDIPFTGEIGGERNISIKDHLHQMQKALASLEEIKEINDKWLKRWMNDSDEIAGFEEIRNKIDEALQ